MVSSLTFSGLHKHWWPNNAGKPLSLPVPYRDDAGFIWERSTVACSARAACGAVSGTPHVTLGAGGASGVSVVPGLSVVRFSEGLPAEDPLLLLRAEAATARPVPLPPASPSRALVSPQALLGTCVVFFPVCGCRCHSVSASAVLIPGDFSNNSRVSWGLLA